MYRPCLAFTDSRECSALLSYGPWLKSIVHITIQTARIARFIFIMDCTYACARFVQLQRRQHEQHEASMGALDAPGHGLSGKVWVCGVASTR